MFDNIITIKEAFTGKLKNEPTLRKWFWVFLSALIFSIVVLGYNSYMSLNFYRKMLERFADMQSSFLPLLVTVVIAVVAYFLISGITGTILDYMAGREYKTKGHEPLFIFSILGLVGLLSLDIYANLQGVDFVAYDTTTEVMANPLDNIEQKFTTEIENTKEEYRVKRERIESKLKLLNRTDVHSSNDCVRECPKHPGGASHWKGNLTDFGKKMIAQYKTDLDALEDQETKALADIRANKTRTYTAAEDDYNRDKGRFDMSVETKQTGHRKMVWFAYGLAIVLSFVCNHYSDRSQAAIHPDREAELIADFESRKERQDAITEATRTRVQLGTQRIKQLATQNQEFIELVLNGQANVYEVSNSGTKSKKKKKKKEKPGERTQIGFIPTGQTDQNPQAKRDPQSEIDPDRIKALIIDILGSMSGDDKTKYLYRFFDENDAKASRQKRSTKASAAKDEAIKLKEEGLTVGEIAAKLGKSDRQIRRYLNE